MTWFDVGALVIVALAVTDGAVSGLLWAVLELGLLAVAAVAAAWLQPHAAPYVAKIVDIEQPDLAWVTYVVVLAVIAVLLLGALFLLHPTSKRWRFSHDGWYGGVLGAFTGSLAAVLVFALAIWCTPRPYEDSLRESPLRSAVTALHGIGLDGAFPPGLGTRLGQLETP